MLVGIEDDALEVVHVSRKERIMGNSSSKGNQIKWKHRDMYVKLDLLGYEGISEVLSSYLLEFSNLGQGEYVSYYQCRVVEDGKDLGLGCYSYDFVGRLTEVSAGNILDDCMLPYSIGYDDFISEVWSVVGFNPKRYVDKVLAVDSIIRNDDRHFNNICFLYDGSRYFPAPIFDFGGGCMSDLISYPERVSFSDNYKSIYAKPFSSDFKSNFKGNELLVIDYDSFVSGVCVDNSSYSKRAFDTIKCGLKEMEGISWKRK